MTGQDAVNSAKAFNDALEDERRHPHQDGRRRPRRSAALSIRWCDARPDQVLSASARRSIGLRSSGPRGIASRIIGQGDLMSLIDKA
ncbi:MAG: hypothetical protein U0797_12795 [Gemmataceae bacterium]